MLVTFADKRVYIKKSVGMKALSISSTAVCQVLLGISIVLNSEPTKEMKRAMKEKKHIGEKSVEEKGWCCGNRSRDLQTQKP